jgi:hypothetical protein
MCCGGRAGFFQIFWNVVLVFAFFKSAGTEKSGKF